MKFKTETVSMTESGLDCLYEGSSERWGGGSQAVDKEPDRLNGCDRRRAASVKTGRGFRAWKKFWRTFSVASQSKRPFRALRRGVIAFGEDNLPVPIHGRHRGDHPAGTGPAACAKTAQASAPPTPVLTLTITRARRVAGNRRLMSVLATTRGAGITDRMSPTPG